MAIYRHLHNAPIIEAIIDIRTKLASNFDLTKFSLLKQKLGENYPQMEERRTFSASIKLRGKEVEQILDNKGLQGYLFKSVDGRNVAQFRRDGFTFSRLKPYTNWNGVITEAKRLWKFYVDEALPEIIPRIAVRYINRLEIPLPINDFEEYLTSPPTIPKSLPQGVSHFLVKITICDEKLEAMANIIQALEKSSKPEHVNIILDIDVFKQEESGFNRDEIWQNFEQLRDLKNRIFFDSITEKTAGLFE
jgi:uncharacterized protein (TIGR04255 family)